MEESLEKIIEDFSPERFVVFFQAKNSNFIPSKGFIEEYNDEIFTNVQEIGRLKFDVGWERFVIFSLKVEKPLSERTGKRKQYEKGKDILKQEGATAGIFIFHDDKKDFRFSLIYKEWLGTKSKYSDYRRYTYFVSRNLTNKTFLDRIGNGDFSTLEGIKKAFSVEKVTEDFYREIANWYFWALGASRFPKDAEERENGRNIAIIRLLTRLMFIWFMKVKGLIPDFLFEEEEVKKILKSLAPEETTYYTAILQNLFFATLNTKQEDRRFRSETRGHRGFNSDYGNHNVYRYHYLFKDPEKMEEYFKDIPFLNGGLFECLDYKPKGKEKEYGDRRIYIDGFTDTKSHQPIVPNFLFFGSETWIDLNDVYGTTNKRYRVEGIINILRRYNFTIDENEPDDVEIALDPELLGRVFENLLASYNPETSTTARKATGSYYTPREIVNYMVEKSLLYYFKEHLSDIPDIEAKVTMLFSKQDPNPFSYEEAKRLIDLIENLRVVDPAVGSGAFPMGMLNKLVFVLKKIDPENKLWKEVQLEAIKKEVKDPELKRDLLERMEEYFKKKDLDYTRKLYLIEKCICGVDIQPIAIEIAKLRFFISLLVDENIDKAKPNWGIIPLPNLDFKLMQGNSLISSFAGIDFSRTKESNGESLGLRSKYEQMIEELEILKSKYQIESDPNKKAKLRRDIESFLWEIIEQKIEYHIPEWKAIERKAEQIPKQKEREHYIKREKEKLFKKHGFDLEKLKKDFVDSIEGRKRKDFFLWEVYFAEVFSQKGGFDIVIGNPPYIEARNSSLFPEELKSVYQHSVSIRWGNNTFIPRGADLLVYFFELGLFISNEYGLVTFITQNSWLSTDYGKKFQQFLVSLNITIRIEDSTCKHFNNESAPNVNTIISFFEKKSSPHILEFRIVDIDKYGIVTIKDERNFDARAKVKNFKWGLLFKCPKYIGDLLNLILEYGSWDNYSLGQGLNVRKDSLRCNYDFLCLQGNSELIPIMTRFDGAPYILRKTRCIIKTKEVLLSNRRKKPSIILPRGVYKKYFATYNMIGAYSFSYVEVYTDDLVVAKKIWIFLNSSIGYLIRELSGRCNLGGGMLKAEASDLRDFPILFVFLDLSRIDEIFDFLVKHPREVGNDIREHIYSPLHRQIDDIVFSAFGISNRMREAVITYLISLIERRNRKSKFKS